MGLPDAPPDTAGLTHTTFAETAKLLQDMAEVMICDCQGTSPHGAKARRDVLARHEAWVAEVNGIRQGVIDDHAARIAAARRFTVFELGGADWADQIIDAYLNPSTVDMAIDDEEEPS